MDHFGRSVAASGDLIVVGAYRERSNATSIDNTDDSASDGNTNLNSGAVYVFKKDAAGYWSQDAYLKASNSGANDSFGESVAISGDMIVVGAYGEESNATSIENIDGWASANDSNGHSGAAYVFKKDTDGIWSKDAYLKSSNNDAGDEFGRSVAISGDMIVVGAYNEASNATSIDNTDGWSSYDNTNYASSAAYVFKKDADGDWSQDAYLKASNNDTGDRFGYSVAIVGI